MHLARTVSRLACIIHSLELGLPACSQPWQPAGTQCNSRHLILYLRLELNLSSLVGMRAGTHREVLVGPQELPDLRGVQGCLGPIHQP